MDDNANVISSDESRVSKEQPDAEFRDHAANERTMLAWLVGIGSVLIAALMASVLASAASFG